MRRIVLEGPLNVRDLGGFPTETGEVTQYGRFLRSDMPTSITDAESKMLLERGITTIIDLRSDWEVDLTPCWFAGKPGFDYYRFPLAGNGQGPATEEEIPASYMRMLDEPSIVKGLFLTIANAPAGVLYHCTAGKDRTGVTSAFLLSLVGVRTVDIVADYQVSHTYIRPLIEKFQKENSMLSGALGYSKPEYIEGFLKLFYEKYESVESYLKELGLTDADLNNIKNKLMK